MNSITPPILVEERVFKTSGKPRPDAAHNYYSSKVEEWAVRIWKYPHPWNTYEVDALLVGGPEGAVLEPKPCASLRDAKREAGRTATVLRGTSEEVVWK